MSGYHLEILGGMFSEKNRNLQIDLYRGWLHGEFQLRYWKKSCENEIYYYMEQKSASAEFRPGLKILAWFLKPS